MMWEPQQKHRQYYCSETVVEAKVSAVESRSEVLSVAVQTADLSVEE